nr:immunoglobulin heavy chain junction region [Mus musculus]
CASEGDYGSSFDYYFDYW